MVLRSSDQPRTVTGTMADTTGRLDELARAQGRGAPALRNSAGHVLELDPASPLPLLSAQSSDSAVKFRDGGIQVRNSIDSAFGDLGAGNGAFAGNGTFGARVTTGEHVYAGGEIRANLGIRAEGAMSCGGVFVPDGGVNTPGGIYTSYEIRANAGIRAEGGMSCGAGFAAGQDISAGGFGYIAGGLRVGIAEAPTGGKVTTREMTAEGNILVKGNIFCAGLYNPPSERTLKNHVADLGDSLAVLRLLLPARWTWRNPQLRDDRTHVGIYVDELADADPDAVITRGTPDDVPTSDPELAEAMSEGRTYEDRALLAHVVRAIQQLDERLTALEATCT